ncbi:MAG: hypothetical protein WD036_00400 [Bauldia sp.]
MKRKLRLTADDPGFDGELDEQIARMRQMLAVMGRQTSLSALGATRTRIPEARPEQRTLAGPAHRA